MLARIQSIFEQGVLMKKKTSTASAFKMFELEIRADWDLRRTLTASRIRTLFSTWAQKKKSVCKGKKKRACAKGEGGEVEEDPAAPAAKKPKARSSAKSASAPAKFSAPPSADPSPTPMEIVGDSDEEDEVDGDHVDSDRGEDDPEVLDEDEECASLNR